MRAFVVCIIFCISCCLPYAARGEDAIVDSVSVRLSFLRGVSELDSALCGNNNTLRRLNDVFADSAYVINSVSVRGSASPEGVFGENNTLASLRSATLAQVVGDISCGIADVDTLRSGIDWDMLSGKLESCQEKWAPKAIEIIDNTPIWVIRENRVVDSRIRRLKRLERGKAWEYMDTIFFPGMRYADCCITRSKKMQDQIPLSAADASVVESEEPVEITPPIYVAESQDYTSVVPSPGPKVKFAVKSNLLYDAALTPNLGIEAEFGDCWSVSADWMCAWWRKRNVHRFWRVYGGELELRRWWHSQAGEMSLTGHHAGVYCQMLTYDLGFGSRGYQGDRWSHAVGLSYGYSLPLGRYFNIDFSIGIGCLWGEYKKYHIEDNCYVWRSTNNRRWFGPTKAEVSIVYVIGGKADKKGGVL